MAFAAPTLGEGAEQVAEEKREIASGGDNKGHWACLGLAPPSFASPPLAISRFSRCRPPCDPPPLPSRALEFPQTHPPALSHFHRQSEQEGEIEPVGGGRNTSSVFLALKPQP